MHPIEQQYTEAARLTTGLSAISHLVEEASAEVKLAYENLVNTASEEEAMHRERNLCENDWAYKEERPSPLIHPDHTDPAKRRAVIVGIVDAEEADLEIETVGPFPMAVDDPEEETTTLVKNEGELLENFHERYGGAMTTISPMPFATRPRSLE